MRYGVSFGVCLEPRHAKTHTWILETSSRASAKEGGSGKEEKRDSLIGLGVPPQIPSGNAEILFFFGFDRQLGQFSNW